MSAITGIDLEPLKFEQDLRPHYEGGNFAELFKRTERIKAVLAGILLRAESSLRQFRGCVELAHETDELLHHFWIAHLAQCYPLEKEGFQPRGFKITDSISLHVFNEQNRDDKDASDFIISQLPNSDAIRISVRSATLTFYAATASASARRIGKDSPSDWLGGEILCGFVRNHIRLQRAGSNRSFKYEHAVTTALKHAYFAAIANFRSYEETRDRVTNPTNDWHHYFVLYADAAYGRRRPAAARAARAHRAAFSFALRIFRPLASSARGQQ